MDPGIAATPKRRRVVTLGIAVAALVGAAAACLAIAIFHGIDTRVVSAEDAATAFAEVRRGLAGDRPLLEVDAQLQLVVHRDRAAQRRPIVALHAISYVPRTRKFVRAEFPLWLLRLATADGRVRLMNIGIIQKDNERITLEDLERHGPGMILDAQLPDRRMLVWTE